MILFFDTETTGLPKNYKAPVTDLDNWPRIVQIAWQIYDDQENIIEQQSIIVKPEGFSIPEEVVKVHGISTERAMNEGEDLEKVLYKFHAALGKSKILAGHNISFDEKIVGAEFIRKKIPSLPNKLQRIDTMTIGTNICKIPGPYGYKWPKLEELYYFLFKTHFENAHNAENDVKASADCFFELKRRNLI